MRSAIMLTGLVDDKLRDLWASLCSVIYRIIAWLFELFMNVAGIKLLTQDDVKPIYNRVTLIISIIMIFYVTLEVVKYIIEPDKMTDKEKGATNIVKKLIIVVVLIAFVPTIFEYAYKLQSTLLDGQVVSKLILGESDTNVSHRGRVFASNMFGRFYYVDNSFWENNGKNPEDLDCDGLSCINVVNINRSNLAQNGNLDYIHMGLNDSTNVKVDGINNTNEYKIRFDGLLATGVGIFILYILILYCIDIGRRVIQLAYLQIIAPIPIIGYLAPKKDNIFNKWVQQCLITYADLFIRLAIIDFVLLVSSLIANTYKNMLNTVDNAGDMPTLIYIVLILGLLLFAHKAPKMIQELLPSKLGAASGNFGLKAGEKIAPAAARTIGFGSGLVRGGVRAAVTRGRNVRKRNQDLKEKLREEGKSTSRRSMRDARKEARVQEKQQRKNYRNKTRQLDKADADYRDAERDVKTLERRLENAKKTNNKDQIKYYTDQLTMARDRSDTAKKVYDNIREGASPQREAKTRRETAENELKTARNQLAEAKRSGRYDRMSKEEQDQLEERVKEAEKNYSQRKVEEEVANRTEDALVSKNTREEYQKAKAASDSANKVLNDAKKDGTYDKMSAEEKKKLEDDAKEATEQLAKAESQYQNEMLNGYSASSRSYEEARSQLARERNQTYGAYAGFQAAGAAIKGMATGAVAGAKATKIGEINKKVNEGLKNIQGKETANSQYLQSGGSATFTGTVDRIVAHEQQNLGIRTESDRIKEEIKHLEDDSKRLNSQASMEAVMGSANNEAKDRSSSKIQKGEQKIRVDKDVPLTNIKASNGEVLVDWKKELGEHYDEQGMTTSDIYQKFSEKESTAISNAEKANQELTQAIMSGASEAEVESKRQKAKELSETAEKAKVMKTQVHKKLSEYGVTKAFQGDMTDPVLASKVANIRTAVENSRNNTEARNYVISELNRRFAVGKITREKYETCYNAFINNDIRDWETADTIEGILTGHAGVLKNQSSTIQEQIRAKQESRATEAADAAAAGGKK